jgi:hypothetical protein
MGHKHRRKGKRSGKNLAKPPKVRHGHCENPACGEKERLRLVVVTLDGKVQDRRQLCRACAAMLIVRLGSG